MFHILQEGIVLVSKPGDGDGIQLNRGNYVGVKAFIYDEVFSYNVTTLSPCSTFILSLDDVEKM